MKTKLIILFLFCSICFVSGQQNENYKKEIEPYEKELKELRYKIFQLEDRFQTFKKSKLTSNLSEEDWNQELIKKQKEIEKEKENFDNKYKLVSEYKNVLINIKKVDVKDMFTFLDEYTFFPKQSTTEVDEEVYIYFGPDKLVKETDLDTNKTKIPFLEDLFSMKSETYLGDFKVSQKGQNIELFREKDKQEKRFAKSANLNLELEKILFSIYEGSIKEAYVTVKDNLGREHLYENKYPISLMRFSSVAPKTSLIYKTSISHNKKEVLESKYLGTEIRFSDILMYIPNPGENYVPDDLSLSFPQKNETDDSNITYKIRQDTSLKNVVELRAYTDFLGLFNNSDNGLIQLEGKAEFFVNPFNITNSHLFIFKKLTPYVNFSRLDNDSKYIEIVEVKDSKYIMEGKEDIDFGDLRLQAIEKAYLDMGFRAYLASYAFSKESPFNMSVYIPIRFLISNASLGILDNSIKKFELKTFGIGGGINLSFKKFNNFVLNYNIELSEFKFKEFNAVKDFSNPSSLWALTNEAEVSYYPGKQKNQSAFVRFRVVSNAEKNIENSFYQFHFGYRFTIPLNTLKR
ncbi:hypothetical protein [Chryseobacterium schmidteae]|uniref:hypothetical protein n=1 Tax=Chryseobacterium schmidteae TaxID=2730404 RepID=UPI001588A85D|nr:hypothetical protein [Chryseobacterium schmidteae]